MMISTGSVTESNVILLYCVISIVALFMCLSLVFTAVWFRPEAELFMTVSVLEGERESCISVSKVAQIGYLY